VKQHPEDICHCGDYRRQHSVGGACSLNGLGHGMPFNEGKCFEFRLAYSDLANYDLYDELWETEDAIDAAGNRRED
jgi:hypothetical protein